MGKRSQVPEVDHILFRRCPDGKREVIAFMLDEPYGNELTSYLHVGQHGMATEDFMFECLPVSKQEAADLEEELISIGYKVVGIYEKPDQEKDEPDEIVEWAVRARTRYTADLEYAMEWHDPKDWQPNNYEWVEIMLLDEYNPYRIAQYYGGIFSDGYSREFYPVKWRYVPEIPERWRIE